MSVARVTEIIASSKKSFEHATESGIKRASETLSGVVGAWVKDQSVTVKNGKVDEYRVNLMISFVLKDKPVRKKKASKKKKK
ncbi:MAG: dodecin family protein [Acidiferrobacterales bacterium]|nr:dodecin family protein [Acidiferrobacterales bacterium]